MIREWFTRKLIRAKPAVLTADRWVAFDTETSGLDPSTCELIAIGGVAVVGERIVPGDSFEAVLAQERVSDKANILIHRMGVKTQLSGLPPKDALAQWLDWWAGAPLLGFHTGFDVAVLDRCLSTHLQLDRMPPMEWLDLAPLADLVNTQASRLKSSGSLQLRPNAALAIRSFDDALEAFSIDHPARHHASGDAWASALLWLKLRAELARTEGELSFSKLQQLARAQRWL